VAASWEGQVFVSANAGQSWAAAAGPTAPWQAVASSADGSRLFAGIYSASGGGIYAAQIAPVLGIKTSPAGTDISWPASASDYGLEERADIVSGNWTAVATPPTPEAGMNHVVVDSSAGNHIYRLVRRQLAQQ
jgi:hypothetical protein